MLLDKEEFDYGKNTHLAMTLFEHISHVHSGKEFSRISKIFQCAADEVHGKPDEPLSNPICLNTDCTGQLQTGYLVALCQEGEVTSRIMYNHVVLLILFWLECKCKNGDTEQEHKLQSIFIACRVSETLILSGIH